MTSESFVVLSLNMWSFFPTWQEVLSLKVTVCITSCIDVSLPLSVRFLSHSLFLSLSTEAFCPFFLVAQPEKATSNALSRLQHLNVTKGDTDECPPLLLRSSPLLRFSLSPRFPCTPTSSHTQPSLPRSHVSLSLCQRTIERGGQKWLFEWHRLAPHSVCV